MQLINKFKGKRGVINLVIIFLALINITLLLTPKANAKEVDDLTKVWAKGATNFYNKYSDLPKAIKELLPSKPTWDAYPYKSGSPYYGYGRQCTWYAYNRAKQNGRTYSSSEGDGGYWGNDVSNYGVKTGTVGNNTPVPQVAVSITGGGKYLGASGTAGHVFYAEYVDKKGNVLLSEGNVITSNGNDKYENYRIIKKTDPNFGRLKFVKPSNAGSIKNYGKNPDGSTVSDDGSSDKLTQEDVVTGRAFNIDPFKPFADKSYKRQNLGDVKSTGILDKDSVVKLSAFSDLVVQKSKVVMWALGAIIILFVVVVILWYSAVPKLGYRVLDKLDGFFGTDNERTASNRANLLLMMTLALVIVGLTLSGAYMYPIIGILKFIEATFL